MFLLHISQNIDILQIWMIKRNDFGFHSNRQTQGHKHQLNILDLKHQVCLTKLRYSNIFLQFRLLLHKPHCTVPESVMAQLKCSNRIYSSLIIHCTLPIPFFVQQYVCQTQRFEWRMFICPKFVNLFQSHNKEQEQRKILNKCNGKSYDHNHDSCKGHGDLVFEDKKFFL